MEVITSKDSKTLKHAMSLLKKKFRKQHGEYLVEGYRSVLDMIPTGTVRYIFIRDDIEMTADLKEAMSTYDIAHYQIKKELLKPLEDTVTSQGIVAVVCKKEYRLSDFTATDGLYVLLDGVQDPGNMGTIIRTAVAAGAEGLLLMKGTVDPYNNKTIRSTMSAITKLPIYEDVNLEDVEHLVSTQSLVPYATSLENSKDYNQVTYAKRSLLMMGNEANGLSDELVQLAQERIHIPQYGPIESLNVAIASALCMYKIRESWQG